MGFLRFQYKEIMGLLVYYLSWKAQSMLLPNLTKESHIYLDGLREGTINSLKACSLKKTQRNDAGNSVVERKGEFIGPDEREN